MKKYFKHKLNTLLVANKIITIHYLELDKNYRSNEEAHNFWELVYADRGDMSCTSDGKEVILRQGEALFHKPNEQHSLAANGKISPNIFVICFECRSDAIEFFENKKVRLEKKQEELIYSIMETARKTFDIPFSNPATRKMKLSDNPIPYGMQIIKNYLELLLINIIHTETKQNQPKSPTFQKERNRLAEEIVSILSNNLYSTLTIEALCEMTNYSKAHIHKEFKSSTGKSVMQYFIDLKIERAKELLRDGDLSVGEIADKLAFDTSNYFSKVFKKETHMTPTAYKKQISSF